MIVVTGPGRSGTSFVARLYRDLGFDPGGVWSEQVNAGLEAPDIVAANEEIIQELGLSTYSPPPLPLGNARKIIASIIPYPLGMRAQRIIQQVRELSGFQVSPIRWKRFNDVVDKYRATLLDLSRPYQVVKDPRFCWTLGVWVAAGVSIGHVLICVRSLDAMVKSRFAAQLTQYTSEEAIKNSFIYGLGLCMMAIYEHGLNHNVVRFPDFLECPEQLYQAMAFPEPVSYDDFLHAFNQLANRELVHFGR